MQKVIIIGATSGIGKALATVYAKNGFIVGITSRRTELLLALQKNFPKNIVVEAFDVTGKLNIPHFQNLVQKLDGLDIFIYNSGYGDISKELEYDIEKTTTDVNVNGFIELTDYAYNYLSNQGHGQLAVISSIAGLRGNMWAPAYSASKAFQQKYFESLQIKAYRNKKNITLTDIRPGYVQTSMSKGNRKFWESTPEKAALQIFTAIKNKRRVAYITRRWWIIGKLLKCMPYLLYRKLG